MEIIKMQTKWEYKYLCMHRNRVEQFLAQLGEEGWEAIGLVNVPRLGEVVDVLLKRPKQP